MKSLLFSISFLFMFSQLSIAQNSFVNAIDFDGNGDYANTLNDPFLPTTNGTLEAWVKVRSITAPIGNAVFEKNEEQWNEGDFYMFFETSSGKLKSRIQSYPSNQADVGSNMSFWNSYYDWVHIAFSWGTEGMRLYIDGELQTGYNAVTNSAMNNTYNFYVGADGYMLHNGNYVVSNFFDGQIDEARIWNYQRTAEQILFTKDDPLDDSYFATLDSGLVGYWRFDELEDLGINNDGVDDVRDLSVLQNHLDLEGDAHLVLANIINPFDPITFEKRYGGVDEDVASSIELTADGGYILCGSTASYGVGDRDILVLKTNADGEIEWTGTYGMDSWDRAHGIKQSNDGSYYIAGYIDGGFGLFDIEVIKIDSIGNILWNKNIGGIEGDELRGISIAPDGGVIVSGYTASFGFGSKDIFLVKFSSDGVKEWERIIGTTEEDHNYSNIVSPQGDIFLAGFSIYGTYWDATITKTDSLGNVFWSKRYGGSGLERIHSVLELSNDGLIVVGQTNSFGSGGDDILVISTDSEGEVIWSKTFGGNNNEAAYSIVQSPDEGFNIAGFTNSYGFGGYDMFLMHLNSSGNLQWFRTYGGNSNDYAYDLKTTPDNGNILVGNSFSGPLGGSDIFLIKADSSGNGTCPSNFYSPVEMNLSLTAFDLSTLQTNGGLFGNTALTVEHPNVLVTNLCSIIPVELISFNYQVQGQEIVLTWATATELNNSGFDIERKLNNTWERIGFVDGNGTTTETNHYSYSDDISSLTDIGTVYYRLKQIDLDGSYKYSDVIEVEIEQPTEYSLSQNYPNPFNPNTTIEFGLAKSGFVTLDIYDLLGNKVGTLVNKKLTAGKHEIKFDASNLSSGIYLYKISAGNYIESKKMILLK